MKIESTMNLNDLTERMGDEDTADIDSDEWLTMLDRSVIHGQ
jgi:hypothetical protein